MFNNLYLIKLYYFHQSVEQIILHYVFSSLLPHLLESYLSSLGCLPPKTKIIIYNIYLNLKVLNIILQA